MDPATSWEIAAGVARLSPVMLARPRPHDPRLGCVASAVSSRLLPDPSPHPGTTRRTSTMTANTSDYSRATGRPAAFFDLDKTVIATSSTLAFSKPFRAGGLITRRAVMRSAYAQFVYHVGGADHDQMEKMRQFLSAMCAGWDVQTVRDIVAETLHTVVDPLVYEEAVSLIEEHHLAGRDVIIVSASGSEVVEPIGELLGADGVVATRMQIVDGRYTGEIDYYAYGENKASALLRLAEENGYDLSRSYAYSDSATDLQMLAAVGNPYVVNPDRELRKEAVARGWPVLVFTRPVALRRRMRLPRSRPTLVAIAVGTAGVVGGAAYTLARRGVLRPRWQTPLDQ